MAALLVCPENYRVNAESVELLYQECQNLTNTPTLFRGLYIDHNLQKKMVLHILLAGLEVPFDRLQGMRTRLEEVGPDIVNRMNRRSSTNLGDNLVEWDRPNPLPAVRRSFGDTKKPVAPSGLPDVKSAMNQIDQRRQVVNPSNQSVGLQPGGLSPAGIHPNTGAGNQPKEEKTEDTYKVLTVSQISDLMETAKGVGDDSKSKDNRSFWNQFKSIKKR
ncbi:MAG TPA: hypothetical protein VHY08_10500 [Bacillota bacterium]|nr:hypothetical protein [Bacillota bacterium]